MAIPDDAAQTLVNEFCDRLAMLLKLRANDTDIQQAEAFIRILLEHEQVDPVALASAIVAHPKLLRLIPELRDTNLYSTPAAKLMLTAALINGGPIEEVDDLCRRIQRNNPLGKVNKQTLGAVRRLIEAYGSPGTTERRKNITINGLSWDSVTDDGP